MTESPPPSPGHAPSPSVDILRALSSTPTPTSPETPLTLSAPAPIQSPALSSSASLSAAVSSSSANPSAAIHEVEGEREKPALVGTGAVVLVEFLLISGKRTRCEFGNEADVRSVREFVWKNWPEEWSAGEDVPTSADSLRLLYLGRFLSDKDTLASLGVQPGVTTIIHLTIRTLDTGYDDDHPLKPAKAGGACGCCVLS